MKMSPNLKAVEPSPNKRNFGVALVFSLVFLLVFTLLAVSVVGNTVNEEKMARNFRDRLVAINAAEAALRDAEIRLTGSWTDPPTAMTGIFDSSCTAGLCDMTVAMSNSNPVYLIYSMAASPAVALGGKVCGGSTAVTGAATGSPLIVVPGNSQPQQPCYLVEWLPISVPGESASIPSAFYRITSVGWGRSQTTQVTLQEEFVP